MTNGRGYVWKAHVMAEVAQALTTGVTALVSAAVGAGLTYWLGRLNRRHQEAREDATRWYEERLGAYVAFHQAVYETFLRRGRARKQRRISRATRLKPLFSGLSMTSEPFTW
jgi:hypothetical protein